MSQPLVREPHRMAETIFECFHLAAPFTSLISSGVTQADSIVRVKGLQPHATGIVSRVGVFANTNVFGRGLLGDEIPLQCGLQLNPCFADNSIFLKDG